MHKLIRILAAVACCAQTFFRSQTIHASSSFDCSAVTEIPLNECQALVDIYTTYNGALWYNHENWLENNQPSSWAGVTVNEGTVTVLDLDSRNMTGPLPPSLLNLPNLRKLSLRRNNFNGSIPDEIGNLVHLTQLDLSFNQLSGQIPATIGNISNLQYLSLYTNRLAGVLPNEIQNLLQLKTIDFGMNQLTGAIPAWLGNMTGIETLNLSGNQFSGPIPSELGNMTSLKSLGLSDNQLTGTIPPALGNLYQLEGLGLAGNQLEGTIPDELYISSLTGLNLGNNQLSGPLPVWLGYLGNLRHLDLSSNLFEGPIPSEYAGLAQLSLLNFFDNQLSGSIPAWLGNLTRLNNLNLSHNQFSGSIPPELGNLSGLNELDLSINQLSGPVPVSFINMTTIFDAAMQGNYGLDLDYNQLTVPATPESLANFLMVTDPDWYKTQAVTAEITPEEKKIVFSNDGQVILTFLQGSVSEPLSVMYSPRPYPSEPYPTDFAFANLSFEIEVPGFEGNPHIFSQPVIFTVNYFDEQLIGVYDQFGGPYTTFENSLYLFFWNGESWIDATDTCPDPSGHLRDPDSNLLMLEICASGEYATLGDRGIPLFLPLVIR